MINIVFLGRGGEGAKTTAILLAKAAINDGKYAQAFPEYGPERRGAPVKAFVRISEKEIRTHSPIEKADIYIIMNKSLLKEIYKNSLYIVNSKTSIDSLENHYFIDATNISQKILGSNKPGIALLGALIKKTGIVTLDSMKEILIHSFGEKNVEMLMEGYNSL